MNLNQKIQSFLNKHKTAKKRLSATALLSLLIALSVVSSLIMPAISMTIESAVGMMGVRSSSDVSSVMLLGADSDIPSGALNFEDRITSFKVDGGTEVNAGNASSKEYEFSFSYSFDDVDGLHYNSPTDKQACIYLTIPKDQITINEKQAGTSDDNTESWKNYSVANALSGGRDIPANYEIIPAGNDSDDNLVIITLNDDYLKYVLENGCFEGELSFKGFVYRDNTQSGDKTVSMGGESVKIAFDDKKPNINKSGSVKSNGNQLPYAHWIITINDIYELEKFLITDTNFANMVEGTFSATPANIFSVVNGNPDFDENGNLVWLANTNPEGKITIEYDAPISEEAIKNNLVSNTVTVSGEGGDSFTSKIEPNLNINASLSKSGKPSYEVKDERGYIYWTVTVTRPYGLSLGGYTVSDSAFYDAELVSVVDGSGNDISGKVTQDKAKFTFAGDMDASEAKITYKTPVTVNSSTKVENNASVTPPGSNTPEDTKTVNVNYDDTNLYSIFKSGSFKEDESGNNDYIEWTVTIDATINQNSYETLNGYKIIDDAFTQDGFEWVSVEAYNNNNYSKLPNVSSAGDILTASGADYIVKSDIEVDKLTLKYRVPLTAEQKEARKNLTGSNTMEVSNTVSSESPEGDKESTENKVNVPGISGSMTIKANKYWVGQDPNKPKSVKLKLQYKLGTDGTWADYTANGVTNPATVTNETTYSWENLPKRDPQDRTKLYYYRVVEVDVPAGYTASDGSSDNTGTNQDGSVITVTNTWNNINIGAVKSWNGISDEDKPETVTLRLLQSTDKKTTWVKAANQNDIVLKKSENYETEGWTGLPKTDSSGNVIYYKVVEVEASLFNDAGVYTGSDSSYDFTVSNSSEYGIDASDYNYNNYNPTATLTNTWRKMNVTAEKYWNGDTNHESTRPDVTFVLKKKVGNNDWVEVGSITLKNDGSGNMIADGSSETNKYTWHGLPKFEGNQSVIYKVEEVPVEGYTASYENSYGINATGTLRVTNTYDKIDISANKVWSGEASPDSRPNTITLRLLKSTKEWTTTESDWTPVEGVEDIVLTKKSDGSFDKAVWTELPKKDSDGNPLFYKIVEIDTPEDYDVSYQYKDNGSNNTTEMTVTNTWNRTNITVNKAWAGDTGQESNRPTEIKITLWQKIGNGEWESTGKSVTMIKSNDGTGKFYVSGTSSESYTWTSLPKKAENGDTIVYKVVEDYVRGYTASYSNSNGVNNNDTITVTNTSNFITVYGSKQWQGDNGNEANRPASIKFRLLQSTTPDIEESWVTAEGTADVELSKRANNTYPQANWTNLPSKDKDGNTIYYKVKEVDTISDYTVSYSSPISNTGTFYVTNTWNNMNLSVNKAWDSSVKNDDRPESLEFKLQRKIGEDGVWTDAGYPNVTVTAADGWTLSNAWTALPRTYTGSDGVVQNIYYRACEIVIDGAKYYAKMDEGTNVTGTSTVTNFSNSIDITVNKAWNILFDAVESDVIVHLMSSNNAGATWTEVGSKTLIFENEESKPHTWTDLPTRDENGYDIIYKVVEDEVEGFTASYSPETIHSTGTITITNTEIPPYEKNATVVSANKLASDRVQVLEQDRTAITHITPTDLKNWKTATVNIKGVDTECYIFKWSIEFRTPTTGNEKYTDTFPEGTVLYNSEEEYMITYQQGTLNAYRVVPDQDEGIGENKIYYYDGDRTIIFADPHIKAGLAYITYCTATPKSIVDNAIASDGYYELTNRIQESKEEIPRDVTLTIKGTDASNTIEKSNETSEQNRKQSIASYSIEINKEGKYLSAGDTINVTDTFAITGYHSSEANSTKQVGYDLVDVNIDSISVYEIDSSGRYTLLSPDEYSYTLETVDDKITDVKDYITKIESDDFVSYGSGQYYINSYTVKTPTDSHFPAGLEVIAEFTGTAGEAVTITNNISSGVEITAIDSVFDSYGKARVKIKFTKTFASGQDVGGYNVNNTTNITIKSATLVDTKQATKTLVHYTVPDGKHLEIVYKYKMTKPDGSELNVGDLIWMQNEASIKTSAGEETSKTSEYEYQVEESTSTIQSGNASKIRKVDIGSYSINNLKAKFVLAKFNSETNEWHYANKFEIAEDDKKYGNYSITYDELLAEPDDAIPDNAAVIDIQNGQFRVKFKDNALYKLIEIEAPEGYEKTPYETGQKSLSANKDNTYYFTYDTVVTDEVKTNAGIPQEKTVTVIPALGTVEVPNIRPISVGASKSWEQIPETQDYSITVQLLQSYTKSSVIPADAAPVENAYSYLTDKTGQPEDGTYIIKNTLKDGVYVCEKGKIWDGLPNGKNGRPIYYYVKEVAYTIGEKTYTLNDAGVYVDSDGKQYTDNAGVEGQYLPTYVDNAVNGNGTVKITNSREFVVKKVWMESDGTITKNPPDVEIKFTLAGITYDGTEVPIELKDEERTLSAANNWKITIPQVYVSMYSKFKVTEELSEANYNYNISDIYALNGSIGAVTLINKDRTPTKVDVVVNKTWGDTGTHKDIEVQLYSGTNTVTYPMLVNMSRNAEYIAPGLSIPSLTDSNGNQIETLIKLGADNSWTYTWEDLPYKDDNGNRLYYYAVEKGIPDGYNASYDVLTQSAVQTINIKNSPPNGSLVLNKNWKDTEGNTLNITEGSVEVEVRRDAVVIEDDSAGGDGGSEETPDEPDVEIQKQNIKVMALGDSITDGYISKAEHGYRKYFYDVITKAGHTIDMVGNKGNNWDNSNNSYTKSDGTVISYDPAHEGYSSAYTSTTNWNIMDIINGKISTSPSSANTVADNQPDVILLLIGTNDIMDAKSSGLSVTEYQQRLQALVTEIFTQKSDTKLFIMSPPPINADSSTADWLNGYQDIINKNTVNAIKAIRNVIESEKTLNHVCYYLDLYTEFANNADYPDYTTLLADYCHPNQVGMEVMGTYIAERLPEILSGGEDDLNKDVTETPDEEEEETPIEPEPETPVIKPDITAEEFAALEEVGTYEITPDKNGNWNLIIDKLPADDGNGKTYVYYIRENTDIYSVEYSGNGQILDSSGSKTISFTNIKKFEPISVNVNKVWADEALPVGVTQPDEVTVSLYRAEQSGLAEEEWCIENNFVKEVTLNADNSWSYEFKNLNPDYCYYVKEAEMDGWTTAYTGNGTKVQDPETTKTIDITVSNTLDVGDLNVEKQWYGDNSGSVNDIQVEVYRVLTPKAESIAQSFSLFSSTMLFGAMADKYVSLSSEYKDVTDFYGIEYDVSELCSGLTINSIEFVYSTSISSANGSMGLNNSWTNYTTSTKSTTFNMPSSYFSNGIPNPLNSIIVYKWGLTASDGNSDVKLIDIRFYYTPKSEINLIESDDDNIEIVVGDTIQLHAEKNKNGEIWTAANADGTSSIEVATVDNDKNKGLVTAKNPGKAKITVQDGVGGATDCVTITVKAFDITDEDGNVIGIDIDAQEGVTKTIELNTVDVQIPANVKWSSDKPEIAEVNEKTGTVTINGFGKANITAAYTIGENNVQTDTVTINVQGKELGLEIDKKLLHIGNEATLTPTPNDNVIYSVDRDGVVSIDGNTVTAIGEGEVTIKATRGDKTASVKIKVAQLKLDKEKVVVPLNGASYLTAIDSIGNLEWNSDNEAVATVDQNGKIIGVSTGSANITVRDEAGGVATAEITVEIRAAEAEIPSTAEKYGETLTISKTNGWTTSLTGLPLTDGQGGVYTYYIKEIGNDSSVYIPIVYEGNGSELDTSAPTTLKVQNMITEEEPEGVEMPSTGGEGVMKYYCTGGAMVLLSVLAGSNRMRRRIKERRTK